MLHYNIMDSAIFLQTPSPLLIFVKVSLFRSVMRCEYMKMMVSSLNKLKSSDHSTNIVVVYLETFPIKELIVMTHAMNLSYNVSYVFARVIIQTVQ